MYLYHAAKPWRSIFYIKQVGVIQQNGEKLFLFDYSIFISLLPQCNVLANLTWPDCEDYGWIITEQVVGKFYNNENFIRIQFPEVRLGVTFKTYCLTQIGTIHFQNYLAVIWTCTKIDRKSNSLFLRNWILDWSHTNFKFFFWQGSLKIKLAGSTSRSIWGSKKAQEGPLPLCPIVVPRYPKLVTNH